MVPLGMKTAAGLPSSSRTSVSRAVTTPPEPYSSATSSSADSVPSSASMSAALRSPCPRSERSQSCCSRARSSVRQCVGAHHGSSVAWSGGAGRSDRRATTPPASPSTTPSPRAASAYVARAASKSGHACLAARAHSRPPRVDRRRHRTPTRSRPSAARPEAEVVDVLDQVRAHALEQLGFAARDVRRSSSARGSAASRTVPRALIHDRLSWLERKKPSSGKATCESSTSAAHRSQSRNSSGRRSTRSSWAYDSSRATADGGAPAAAWSATTRTSRRWYEPYSENRNVTTRATMPRPVIAAIVTMMRAGPQRPRCRRTQGSGPTSPRSTRRAQVRRDRLELVADGEQDQAIADDQGDEPGDQQRDRHRRREEAEHPVVGATRSPVPDGPEARATSPG